VTRGGDRAVALYRFTAGSAWGAAGGASVNSGALTLALPARSATLAVIAAPTTAVGAPPAGAPGAVHFGLRALPNPTAAGSAFEFSLPRAATVTLALYDVAGRRVRAVAAGAFAAGAQHVQWDGRDERGIAAPPGHYEIKLAALGHVETRPLVRLR